MSTADLRCVLVPVTGADLLLPNAAIAEVADFSTPEPISDAPEWLAGMILWRGWQVPLIKFALLAGLSEQEDTGSTRLCVLKSLMGSGRMPYVALLAQGFPRLTTIDDSSLTQIEHTGASTGIAGMAMLEDSKVIVPDLDELAQLAIHAAFGAAPMPRS
ncbi:MAG: chemotaxis protein CheW [Wenzhouxiangella sp.]|nr:chemotaxis protein CheW [Wenzhouxiangella sp.]